MSILVVFIASLLGIVGYTSATFTLMGMAGRHFQVELFAVFV